MIDDDLITDIREAFDTDAEGAPSAAYDRITAHGYRPRRPFPRPTAPLVAAAVVGTAAAATVGLTHYIQDGHHRAGADSARRSTTVVTVGSVDTDSTHRTTAPTSSARISDRKYTGVVFMSRPGAKTEKATLRIGGKSPYQLTLTFVPGQPRIRIDLMASDGSLIRTGYVGVPPGDGAVMVTVDEVLTAVGL